jgi:hypothetical protein
MVASLTGCGPRRENRASAKRAIDLLALCMAALLGVPLPARAAEPPRSRPDGCVEEALERAQLTPLPDPSARAARASWVPRLGVGLRSDERIGPGVTARAVEVFAWLRWPLSGRGSVDLGPLSARRQQLAADTAERATRLTRIRMRPRANTLRGRIDDTLDAEEARAGLAALGAEECP